MLEAHCVYLKKRGLAKTEHKPPIADEDIKKLYESGVSIQSHYRQSRYFAKQSPSLKLCSSVVEEGRISVNYKRDDFAIKRTTRTAMCWSKNRTTTHEKPSCYHDAQAEVRGNDVCHTTVPTALCIRSRNI